MRPNLYRGLKLVIPLKHSPNAREFSPHFFASPAGSVSPLLLAEHWRHFQIASAVFARSLPPLQEYPRALFPSAVCRGAACGRKPQSGESRLGFAESGGARASGGPARRVRPPAQRRRGSLPSLGRRTNPSCWTATR